MMILGASIGSDYIYVNEIRGKMSNKELLFIEVFVGCDQYQISSSPPHKLKKWVDGLRGEVRQMKELKMKILFKQNDVKFDQKIAPAICNIREKYH